MKQPVEKQKMIRYAKALPKDKAERSSTPYRFDVLAQLANIPARLRALETIEVNKSSFESSFTDAEVFMAQILAEPQEEDEEDCLHASQYVPYITSHQTTCRSSGNMIGPCTSQGISDRLK